MWKREKTTNKDKDRELNSLISIKQDLKSAERITRSKRESTTLNWRTKYPDKSATKEREPGMKPRLRCWVRPVGRPGWPVVRPVNRGVRIPVFLGDLVIENSILQIHPYLCNSPCNLYIYPKTENEKGIFIFLYASTFDLFSFFNKSSL